MDAFVDAIEEGNEAIAESTERIIENADALEAWSDSAEKADASAFKTTKRMNPLVSTTGKYVVQLTGLPPIINQTTIFLGRMTGGLGAATTGTAAYTAGTVAATGATSALSAAMSVAFPVVSIVAATVYGAFKLIDYFSGDAVNSFDELVGKASELYGEFSDIRSELLDIQSQLSVNNGLISEMNALGADDSFIQNLREANELLEIQYGIYNRRAYDTRNAAADAAYEMITSNAFTGYLGPDKSQPSAGYYHDDLLWNQQADLLTSGYSLLYTNNISGFVGESLTSAQMEELDRIIDAAFEAIAAFENVPEYAGISDELVDFLRLADELFDIDMDVLGQLGGSAELASAEIERLRREAEEADIALKKLFEPPNLAPLKSFTNTYIDLATEIDALASAYDILSDAVSLSNDNQNISVDLYYELMKMSPEYLNILMAEDGALRDLNQATRMLTMAKIDEMGLSKAREMLALASTYQEESGSLAYYAASLDITTNSMWGLIDAQMKYMELLEATNLAEKGYSAETAAQIAEKNMQAVRDQVDMIMQWTESAKASALSGGISQQVDSVGRVSSVDRIREPVRLADEDIRMLVDLAERENIIRINAPQLSPNIEINVGDKEASNFDANDAANAIKFILMEQVANHTDQDYLDSI